MKIAGPLLLLFALGCVTGCSSDNGQSNSTTLNDAKPFVENYVAIVRASYADSLTKTKALKTAIDAFVASPDASTLNAARQAWLDAREPYGQTEVYRFYEGPIDDADGPEGQINAWPLDEAYIDYVEGNATAGIINDPQSFPTLSKEVLAAQNEQGGETNIATGYHAIEFLLWGQDLNAAAPGDRPHTDYIEGVSGTAVNQDRRKQYLSLVTELLIDDLESVQSEWADGATNYAAEFLASDPKDAVRRVLLGMGSLSGAELSGERMTTAYDNKDQEDEHSCFSDNTHRDIYNNALSIQNIYLGRYGSIDGPGLDDIVRSRDPALDEKMRQQLEDSLAAVEAIPAPFDQAILGDDTSDGRVKVLAAIRALQAQTETIVEIATLLGIQINLE